MKVFLDINFKKNNIKEMYMIKDFLSNYKNLVIVFDYESDTFMYEHINSMFKERNDVLVVDKHSNEFSRILKINKKEDIDALSINDSYRVSDLRINFNLNKEDLDYIVQKIVNKFPYLIDFLVCKTVKYSEYGYILIDENLDVYITNEDKKKLKSFCLGNIKQQNVNCSKLEEMNRLNFYTKNEKCLYCNNIYCKPTSFIESYDKIKNSRLIDEKECEMHRHIEKVILSLNNVITNNIYNNMVVPYPMFIETVDRLNIAINKLSLKIDEMMING